MDSAQLDTPPATPSPREAAESGQIVAERYRLIRKLGEGGMGAVYLAEHVHMRKRFALKLLLPEAMSSAELVARFEREAIAAGNIEHPGVCAATDFGRLPDGAFFLVLEYVDGRSLRHVIADGPMPPARACAIARQILAALAAAHGKGVVHRDMKPENVMLTTSASGDEVVKVLDFGIAKVTTLGEGEGPNLTRMGAIYGTPAYMAPEQAMGKAIDHRADLYAVGVMLHEMITGRAPFDGDGVIILAKHVNDPPPLLASPLDPTAVSDDLRAVVSRLLAKKADERPVDAASAIAELDMAVATLGAPIAWNRTALGDLAATAPTSFGTPSPIAEAATVYGDPSPTPPPVAMPPSPRDRIVSLFVPLSRRVGVEARFLALGTACLAGLFFLLLLIVLVRPSRSADDEADERRSRRRPATTTASTGATAAKGEPKSEATSPAPSASTSGQAGKGSGGGIKGLGRKIKGLF